jgi:hypothetical protein
VISISFFRQGVDNIANTLNAWDRERDAPKGNVEDYITRFSAADMAVFFSYAKRQNEQLSYGASAKIIHHKLGAFAQAWGYSLDVGVKYKTEFADFGASVQDITTMQKMWDVDESAFGDYEAQFDSLGATLPSGQNEYVLPSMKLGASKLFNVNEDFKVIAATDVDLLFENRRAYYINIGEMSIEPHVGAEVSYKDIVAFRTGITNFITDPISGFTVSPTLGMGLKLSSFILDYGFASFAGAASGLLGEANLLGATALATEWELRESVRLSSPSQLAPVRSQTRVAPNASLATKTAQQADCEATTTFVRSLGVAVLRLLGAR